MGHEWGGAAWGGARMMRGSDAGKGRPAHKDSD